MSESHTNVAMEQHVCVVCGTRFNTGNVLMDMRLKKRLGEQTVTGLGLCPADQAKFDQGFIALVAIDPERSSIGSQGQISPTEVHRTGTVAHVSVALFKKLFNVPVPNEGVTFVPASVIEALDNLQSPQEPK